MDQSSNATAQALRTKKRELEDEVELIDEAIRLTEGRLQKTFNLREVLFDSSGGTQIGSSTGAARGNEAALDRLIGKLPDENTTYDALHAKKSQLELDIKKIEREITAIEHDEIEEGAQQQGGGQ